MSMWGIRKEAFFSYLKTIALKSTFFIYSCIMVWELFIGPYRTRGGGIRYNLIPFKTIKNLLVYRRLYTANIFFINLIGNIITFIPLGFFLPVIYKKMRKAKVLFACCFFIILSAELIQLIFKVGSFDVDDIILNIIGCITGYGIYRMFSSRLKKQHN